MDDGVIANKQLGASATSSHRRLDVQGNSALQRRLAFSRKTQFEDPTLSGLFTLLREARDRDSRIELSGFVRERLRAAFPAGSGERGEVLLANGLRITVDLGDSFGAEFMVGHLNEYDLLDAVVANIPDGAKIVDVGANFGLYALHSAWAAGTASQVVAFEPLPSAGSLLQHNTDANELVRQITFVASAVGAQRGKANFYIAEDGAFSGLHDTKRSRLAETIEVPVVSLDESPEVMKLGSIDFLKVDVEGHEGSVLAGARKLMEISPGLLAVLEFSHKNLIGAGRTQFDAALRDCLASGFRIWLHDDQGVRAAHNIADELAGDVSGTIILAARGCYWADGLIASLAALCETRARSDVSHGLKPLIAAVREGRYASKQAEELQKDSKILQARIDRLSGQADAFRKSAEAQHEKLMARTKVIESANATIIQMRAESAEANAKIARLEAEIAEHTQEPETRRTAKQQLQQWKALLRLGKHKS